MISKKSESPLGSNGIRSSEKSEIDIEACKRFKSYCRLRSYDGINNSFFKFVEPHSKPNQVLSVNRSLTSKNIIEDLGGKFYFDFIFDEEYTQIEVFQDLCIPLIDKLVDERKSSLLMAHGLNDSGKTYTIVGDSENPGLIPLTLRFLYEKTNEIKNKNFEIFCNFSEVYDSNIVDLLSSKKIEIIKK
jgi:hypothetical protein